MSRLQSVLDVVEGLVRALVFRIDPREFVVVVDGVDVTVGDEVRLVVGVDEDVLRTGTASLA